MNEPGTGRSRTAGPGTGFPHLHVASAYSTHYGVTLPEALAGQARAQGLLTDVRLDEGQLLGFPQVPAED
ncbi:hypothetical protein QN345_17680, partial [Cryobacterium sp. 10I1]|uniref:hypothetical protein n=1 Tax=Cryobacterium sp. 10I1 TaxID=3048578 RepID=UPI002B222C7A